MVPAKRTKPAAAAVAGAGSFLIRSFLASLTKRIRPVDGDPAKDRIEEFDYDFRDRLIGEQFGDGTNTYFVRLVRDNLAADTVVEQSETLYDAAGNTVQRTAS
jgi:hypothetical protein